MTQLCTLLNADADVQAICSYIPLKESTIKEWIDKQGPHIAEAGIAAANKAAAQGGEAVHGGPSKVQIDWMEAFERYKKVTETVDSVGKESSKGKLQVKTSTAAEAMFASVSKMCGNAHRETAIHKVIARREGQSSPSPASVSSPSPHGLSSESSQSSFTYNNETEDDSPQKEKQEQREYKRPNAALKPENKMEKFFSTIETVLVAHSAGEADTRKLEAEAKKLEAEAKNTKAKTKSQDGLMEQLEKVTAIHKTALESGDTVRAAKYKQMMEKIDDQLLAALGD